MAHDKTLVPTLRRAKQKIEAGWCQKKPRRWDEDGKISYCLSSALLTSLESSVWYAIDREVEAQVRMDYPNFSALSTVPKTFYIKWNDAPGRTQEQVVALLGRLIERLENSNGT
jgi:hypothetical protein